MDEAQLSRIADAFRKGDLRSFRVLVESLTRSLIATAYRYTQDWESARDLTQETWIKVYERIAGYDPARPFRPWLTTIHRNGCMSHLRKAATQREIAVDHETIDQLSASVSDSDPRDRLMQREFGARLRKAMLVLTESQRTVFASVDLEQIDQREAARKLSMNAVTLRTTLHNARKRLATLLRKMEERPWTQK